MNFYNYPEKFISKILNLDVTFAIVKIREIFDSNSCGMARHKILRYHDKIKNINFIQILNAGIDLIIARNS